MKKFLSFFLLLCVMASCDDSKDIIKLDTREVKLACDDSGSETISFYSDEAWIISFSGASWLSVDPMSGDAGSATVTVSATEANTGEEPRSVKVTIKAGGDSKSFTVKQHSEASQEEDDDNNSGEGNVAGFFVAGGFSYPLNNDAQNLHLTVMGKEHYTLVVDGDASKWITVGDYVQEDPRGAYPSVRTYLISVGSNKTGADRVGFIWAKDADNQIKGRINISQTANPQAAELFTFNGPYKEVFQAVAPIKTYQLTLKEKASLNVSNMGFDWIDVSYTGEYPNYTVTVSVDANKGGARYGSITIDAKGQSLGEGITMFVEQQGAE